MIEIKHKSTHAVLLCVDADTLAGHKMVGVQLRGADLGRRRIWNASNLANSDLREADLRRAKLTGATLNEACLRGAIMEHADLSGADCTAGDLNEAQLVGANLSGAIFRYAQLVDADLKGADLSGADLSMADVRANFNRAILRNADLRAANLMGANLVGASLEGADMTDAKLGGATLVGAKMAGAIDVQGRLCIDRFRQRRRTEKRRPRLGGVSGDRQWQTIRHGWNGSGPLGGWSMSLRRTAIRVASHSRSNCCPVLTRIASCAAPRCHGRSREPGRRSPSPDDRACSTAIPYNNGHLLIAPLTHRGAPGRTHRRSSTWN